MPQVSASRGLDVRADGGYSSEMSCSDQKLLFGPPHQPLDEASMEALRSDLSVCPDVAFSHLVDVQIGTAEAQPSLSLFVWLVPAAVRSLRKSLNLVSEVVAGAISQDRCVDVLILNSAPELLADVERAGCLLVERDADERTRALAAMAGSRGPG